MIVPTIKPDAPGTKPGDPGNGHVLVIDPKHQKFNGRVYGSTKDGYYKCYIMKKEHALHIDVYEFHCGKVPEGCVVHHEHRNPDGTFDKSENNIEWLRLMTSSEHLSYHGRNRATIEKICECCGKPFTTSSLSKKYCSKECCEVVISHKKKILERSRNTSANEDVSVRIQRAERSVYEGRLAENEGVYQFVNRELGISLRCRFIDGEPWFVGRDVAKALGYKDVAKAVYDHVEPEDKGVDEFHTLGGKQKMIIINLNGLLDLSSESQLPTAKILRRWIIRDVLSKIMKLSMYMSTAGGGHQSK